MEQRGGADACGLSLEVDAAGALDVFELLDTGKGAIDQAGVGQQPEVFGGLQLGRVRRQKEQMDMIRHAQMDAGMPAGPVQDEDDLFIGTGSSLAGERGQLHFKERDADGGRQMEEGAPRGGMDEANQIAPREPMTDRGEGTLPNRRPDATQQRFQADAMFIGGPELDLGVREGGGHGAQQRPQLFLKASCSSASARACRGRGACKLCLIRTR